MLTTFNRAVTETASESLGKHCQKNNNNKKTKQKKHNKTTNTWVTAEILDLCDKERERRKKRFEPERSEK